MKKNSNFKNISYSNFEFIAIFITLMFCTFISNIINNIIRDCESASIIGTAFLCIISYLAYYFITRKIFENEYDFFEVIKKTYPIALQKIIGILIYLFCAVVIYVMVFNIVYVLKSTTYSLATTSNLAIYFVVALLLVSMKGFNSIFRIAGYICIPILAYIAILFVISLPYISLTNFLPILGTGASSVFGNNLENLAIFTPFFFMLFFGGTIKKQISRDNTKNFKRIFAFSTLTLFFILIMFVGSMPADLLNTRFTLLFDISRIVSFSTVSVRIAPIMIFVFSFIVFLASSFVLLVGCMSLERLNVIKDYSKSIIITIIGIGIFLLMPSSLIQFHHFQLLFNYISIGVAFGFPILTLIIYSIKRFMKKDNTKEKRFETIEKSYQEVSHYE